MTQVTTDKAVFRIRDHLDSGGKQKGYERSYEIFDEQSQKVVTQCDLIGSAVLKPQLFLVEDGKQWCLDPNRKIMPSLWALYDSNGRACWHFRQKIWGKLLNPFHKTLISVLDGEENEQMRLVDLHGAKIPVVLGLEWGKYALMKGEQPLATFTSLPRKDEPQGKGLMGAVHRFLHSSDAALVSVTSIHPLPAPAALALYLLYKEFTDTSGAG
jgi:hypothetical protein